MTYHQAFQAAREACRDLGRTVYLLHSPETCDGPLTEAYDYADDIARVYLFHRSRVLVTFRPLPNAVEVFPAPACSPRR